MTIDRKYSDPNDYDNSIDWDDLPDGSNGGYTKHGNYIVSEAMVELIALRIKVEEQAAEIERLKARIKGHNAEVRFACEVHGDLCKGFRVRDMRCPECPLEWVIEEEQQ